MYICRYYKEININTLEKIPGGRELNNINAFRPKTRNKRKKKKKALSEIKSHLSKTSVTLEKVTFNQLISPFYITYIQQDSKACEI